jgi:hypothetical protein
MSSVFTLVGQLRLVGATLAVLGLAHLVMPRALAWRPEFATLRPLTRQIMYAHTFFIGLTCLLLGLAPLALTTELLTPGRTPTAILAAEVVFWGLRWCAQFVAFPQATWRSSPLYVAGYVGFTVLWTWVVTVFAAALTIVLTAQYH